MKKFKVILLINIIIFKIMILSSYLVLAIDHTEIAQKQLKDQLLDIYNYIMNISFMQLIQYIYYDLLLPNYIYFIIVSISGYLIIRYFIPNIKYISLSKKINNILVRICIFSFIIGIVLFTNYSFNISGSILVFS